MLQVDIVDRSTALDLIFGFLQLAQGRGSFSLAESAKIFECMNQFKGFYSNEEEEEYNEEEDSIPQSPPPNEEEEEDSKDENSKDE